MEQLIICPADDGRYAVRPVSWAGIWDKSGLLASECKSIAYFDDEQDAKDYIVYHALGTIEELSALVKARDEGRVVVLPCKVGDTIFVIPSKANFELNKISHPENNRVYEQIISSVNWYHKSRYLVRTCDDFCSVLSSEYGITWFLTRAEAEAALGGGGDGA